MEDDKRSDVLPGQIYFRNRWSALWKKGISRSLNELINHRKTYIDDPIDVNERSDELPRQSHVRNTRSGVWKERNRRVNELTHQKSYATFTDEAAAAERRSHVMAEQQQQIMDMELWEAAKNGDVDNFIFCLEKLMISKDDDNNDYVSTIISKLTAPHQDTLLHVAARYGQEEMAGFIADHFPQLVTRRNNKGNSALHLAARFGHLGVVAMFLRVQQANQVEKGIDDHELLDMSDTVICLEEIHKLVAVNDEGNTALHEAMLYDHKDVASCLIECNIEAAYFVNREGKSPLHMAAEAGNIEHVRDILLATSDYNYMHLLDEQLVKGKSILHAAIRGKNIEILQAIVETKPMHMHLIEEDGLSPLDFASSTGFLEGVKFLEDCSYKKRKIEANIVDNDFQKNTTELREESNNGRLHNHIGQISRQGRSQLGEGRTMSLELYECAKKGDIAAFRDFLNSERTALSIYNHKTPQKNTFLHIAAKFGNEELTKFILGDFPKLLFVKNERGDTPLHVAAAAGHLPLVRILFEFQMENDSLLDTQSNDKMINWFNERIQVNNDGNTPLHEAVMNDQADVMVYLIEQKVEDAYYVNNHGKSALYTAIEANYIDSVRTILSSGLYYDYRYIQYQKVNPGKSLILAAAKVRNEGLLVDLTKMKNAVKIFQNETGQTPLQYAISVNFARGVKVLLRKHKMSIIKKDADGLYPVHWASKYGRVDILEMLLDYCPDEFATEDGQNILHVASHYGKFGVVRYILKTPGLEMLMNQKDKDGNTPLHLAVKNSHPRIVSFLTWDKRSDIKLRVINNKGLAPADIAEELFHYPMENQDATHATRTKITWVALYSAGARKANPNRLFEKFAKVNVWKDRVNTLLLMSALIATVTFAAGFTMPGGYSNSEPDPGMATLLNNKALQIFVICDTIAMYSAILVSVTLIWAQINIHALTVFSILIALQLLSISLIFMSLAFIAGVYVVVSKLVWLSYLVIILGFFFLACILTVMLPLCTPFIFRRPIIRHISYYSLHIYMWAVGCYNEPPVEMYHS